MKGLIAKIYEDDSATAPTTGNIDVFISPVSVIGRKNLAFLKELYLGKLTKTLRDRVTSMAQNSKVKTDTIIKFVLDYYKLICSENTYKSVEKKLSDMTIKQARDFFLEPEMNICTIIEPFQDVTFDAIRTAAKMLKVPLDEYVTIKTEDGRIIKTDRPVPVGISYKEVRYKIKIISSRQI